MKEVCKLSTIITLDHVKELAPLVFKDVLEHASVISNIVKMTGIEIDDVEIDILEDFDISGNTEYDEKFLESYDFHFLVVRYIYAMKIMETDKISIYDAIQVSKMARSAVLGNVEDEENLSVDAKLIEAFNISADALPEDYRIQVYRDSLNAAATDKVYEILNAKYKEEDLDLKMFEDWNNFDNVISELAAEMSDELETIGFIVVNSRYFKHFIMSILFKMGDSLPIEMVSDVNHKFDDALEEAHEVVFRHKHGDGLPMATLIKSMAKVHLMMKGIDGDIEFLQVNDEEEDDGDE